MVIMPFHKGFEPNAIMPTPILVGAGNWFPLQQIMQLKSNCFLDIVPKSYKRSQVLVALM